MFRQWLNQNSAMVTTVAVVILVIALGLVVWNMTGNRSRGSDQAYFYDLNTKQLITDRATRVPPFSVSSGSELAVGATVYACGNACGDPQQRQIGYLWRYTPKGAELAEQANALLGSASLEDQQKTAELKMQAAQERQIRKVDGDQWLSQGDAAASTIDTQLYRSCTGSKKFTFCSP